MKSFSSGVAFCLASLLAACSSEVGGNEPLTETEDNLYWQSTQTWVLQRDISVCWTFDGNETEKTWVKQALMGQRSWSSAGYVNFTGWGRCGTADIRISKGQNGTGTGGSRPMFLDFASDVHTVYSRCIQNSLDRAECIRTTAIHEFGHGLGYLHEQNRDDVAVPASCGSKTDDGFDGDSTFGAFDVESIGAYCNFSTELSALDRRGTERIYGPRFGDSPTLGDYNADGRQDLFCHDVTTGEEWTDLADASGQFVGTDWYGALGWCDAGDHRRLFQGDFNGDSRTDLLCFDLSSGDQFIDYASNTGTFGGTDWFAPVGWCDAVMSRRLYVGDFNGDGKDDLLCHDRTSGEEWLDYADGLGHFGGTDWYAAASWCDAAPTRRLHVGDFNGDGKDDLLCHDLTSGERWVDFASSTGQFGANDAYVGTPWCAFQGAGIFVGDFNGDNRSDLLCHSAQDGNRWIDYASSTGGFGATNYTAGNSWCRTTGTRLFVGDVNGDNRDDLVCHKVAAGSSLNGTKYVDYATSSGQLAGTDFTHTGWCAGASSREFM